MVGPWTRPSHTSETLLLALKRQGVNVGKPRHRGSGPPGATQHYTQGPPESLEDHREHRWDVPTDRVIYCGHLKQLCWSKTPQVLHASCLDLGPQTLGPVSSPSP